MPVCPACDTATPEGSVACPKCGLAAELFHPIREAVGLPRSDPRYIASVQEILSAIGGLPSDTPAETGPAELANASRFPAMPPASGAPSPTPRLIPLPELPQLAAGAGLPALRQQVAEFIEIARRRGLDVYSLEERAEALAVVDDLTELEHLDRDLFVQLAASLADELEQLLSRQREIAHFLPTTALDAEVDRTRSSLGAGDLAGAQRELRRAAMTLEALSGEWGPVEILVTEGELLKEVVIEFGGDPSPALGEFDEGRRLARTGDRTPAEEALTRATLALWSIAKPLLEADLAQRMEEILRLRSAGADVRPVLLDLKEFGVQLKARNFPSAIDLYRRAGRDLEAAARAPRRPADAPDAAVKSDPSLPAP